MEEGIDTNEVGIEGDGMPAGPGQQQQQRLKQQRQQKQQQQQEQREQREHEVKRDSEGAQMEDGDRERYVEGTASIIAAGEEDLDKPQQVWLLFTTVTPPE